MGDLYADGGSEEYFIFTHLFIHSFTRVLDYINSMPRVVQNSVLSKAYILIGKVALHLIITEQCDKWQKRGLSSYAEVQRWKQLLWYSLHRRADFWTGFWGLNRSSLERQKSTGTAGKEENMYNSLIMEWRFFILGIGKSLRNRIINTLFLVVSTKTRA